MTTVTVSQFRKHLDDIIDKVACAGDRVRIERKGKPVMALVSVEDLELLEMLEDQMDMEMAREALQRPGFKPWDQVKKEQGL